MYIEMSFELFRELVGHWRLLLCQDAARVAGEISGHI